VEVDISDVYARLMEAGGSKQGAHTSRKKVASETQVNVIPDDDFNDSDSASESDRDEERVLWARLGVEAEAYIRRRSIWKNVIKGKGRLFASADAFRCTI